MTNVDVRTANGCFSEAEVEARFGVPSTKLNELRITGLVKAGVIYIPMIDDYNDSIEMSQAYVYTDSEILVARVLMNRDTIGEPGRKLAKVAAGAIRRWDYMTRYLLVTLNGAAFYNDRTVAVEDAHRLGEMHWLIDMSSV